MIHECMKWIKSRISGERLRTGERTSRLDSRGGIKPTDQELELIKRLSAPSPGPGRESAIPNTLHQPGIIFSGLKAKLSSEELISRVAKEIELEGLETKKEKPEAAQEREPLSRPLTELESNPQTGHSSAL